MEAAVGREEVRSTATIDGAERIICVFVHMPSCDCSPALLSDLRGTLSGAHSVASSLDRPSRIPPRDRSFAPSLFVLDSHVYVYYLAH